METNRKRRRRAVKFWRKAWAKCLAGQSKFPCHHPRGVIEYLWRERSARQKRLTKTLVKKMVAEISAFTIEKIVKNIQPIAGEMPPQTVRESVDKAVEKVESIWPNLQTVQNRKPKMQRMPTYFQSPS